MTSLPAAVSRRIALAIGPNVDPRTVEKAASGRAVKGHTGLAILLALRSEGLVKSDPATITIGRTPYYVVTK